MFSRTQLSHLFSQLTPPVFFFLSLPDRSIPRMILPKSLQPRNCIYPPIPLMKNLTSLWMGKQCSESPTLFPYHCETCGKGYQHRATLLRHTRHECGKEPKFKCPYCAHRTKQRGNLYQHIRTNHPGRNVFSSSI